MQEKRLQSLDNISIHGFPLLCLRLLLSLPLAVVIKSQSQTTPHPSLSPLCFLSLGLLLFKSHPAASACLRFLDFFFFFAAILSCFIFFSVSLSPFVLSSHSVSTVTRPSSLFDLYSLDAVMPVLQHAGGATWFQQACT